MSHFEKSTLWLTLLSVLLNSHVCFGESNKSENLYFMNREENGSVTLNTCDERDCYRVAVAPKEKVEAACFTQQSTIVSKVALDVTGAIFGVYAASLVAEAGGYETLSIYGGPVRRAVFSNFGKYLSKIKPTRAMAFSVGIPETIVVKGGKILVLKWATNHWEPVNRIVDKVESKAKEIIDPRPNYNLAKVLCGNSDGNPISSKSNPSDLSNAVKNANVENVKAIQDAMVHAAF